MWKLEFWKLEIKFGNQNFEELIWEWEFKKEIKFQDWNFENENLKIKFKKREFWKIIWEYNFLKIRFEINWSFENLFEGDILKN